MPRLKTIGSKLSKTPAKLKSASTLSPTYGQGRGGRPWRRLRESILVRDQYLCQPCKAEGRLTEATQVDHITPQAEGGTDDRTNLQSICDMCHEAKTKEEAARGIHRAYGGTGRHRAGMTGRGGGKQSRPPSTDTAARTHSEVFFGAEISA